MKARIKATGEIVEVIAVGTYINEFGTLVGDYKTADGIMYASYDLDFYIEEGITIPDYWTRLEHTYAGMAMQGILSNPNIVYKDISTETICNHVAERVKEIAHALVEKLKEKEERK